MSNPGNFDSGQQPVSNQPAPGWYFAQGDPPGTERYWNGASWEGTYRAVGGFSPSVATARPPGEEFPSGITVLAWVVTVLKALPLILGAIGLALIGSLEEDIEAEADVDLDLTTAVYVVGAVMVAIGVVLLIGQIRAIMKKDVGQGVIWAGILTLLDVAYLFFSVLSGDVVSALLGLFILIAQGAIFGWLMKLRSSS